MLISWCGIHDLHMWDTWTWHVGYVNLICGIRELDMWVTWTWHVGYVNIKTRHMGINKCFTVYISDVHLVWVKIFIKNIIEWFQSTDACIWLRHDLCPASRRCWTLSTNTYSHAGGFEGVRKVKRSKEYIGTGLSRVDLHLKSYFYS